jgi:hypothetical protein
VLWVIEGVKVHAFMCKAAPGLVGVEVAQEVGGWIDIDMQ